MKEENAISLSFGLSTLRNRPFNSSENKRQLGIFHFLFLKMLNFEYMYTLVKISHNSEKKLKLPEIVSSKFKQNYLFRQHQEIKCLI
jgi:hypothetical protein